MGGWAVKTSYGFLILLIQVKETINSMDLFEALTIAA